MYIDRIVKLHPDFTICSLNIHRHAVLRDISTQGPVRIFGVSFLYRYPCCACPSTTRIPAVVLFAVRFLFLYAYDCQVEPPSIIPTLLVCHENPASSMSYV